MPLLLIAVPTSLATTLLVIFGVLPLIFVAWLCCGCKDRCNPGLLLERFRERWSHADDSLSIYVFFTGVRARPLAHVGWVRVLQVPKEFDTELTAFQLWPIMLVCCCWSLAAHLALSPVHLACGFGCKRLCCLRTDDHDLVLKLFFVRNPAATCLSAAFCPWLTSGCQHVCMQGTAFLPFGLLCLAVFIAAGIGCSPLLALYAFWCAHQLAEATHSRSASSPPLCAAS